MFETINHFLHINRNTKSKVFVIGDIIIDEYYDVKVSRINPEHPTQIMKSGFSPPDICCGGASNIANQFRNFNVDCSLFGIIDRQAFNAIINHVKPKFNFHPIFLNNGYVPRKKRCYHEDYPLPRWDIEEENFGANNIVAIRRELQKLLEREIRTNKPDVIIFSDYDKGTFGNGFEASSIIQICNDLGIKTIVDPKKIDLAFWKGCSVIKPNAKESKDLTGCDDIASQYKKIKDTVACDKVIITNGGCGLYGDYIYDVKYDCNTKSVIGAGDVFSAILAICLAANMDWEFCIKTTYACSIINVENNIRNEPLHPLTISRYVPEYNGKLVNLQDLKDLKDTISFTNGVFDVLHCAHIDLLSFAKSKANKLLVAINDDDSVKRLKGQNRPINNLSNRIKMLSSLDVVDYIIPFEEDTPHTLISNLPKNVLKCIVKGGDYEPENVVGCDIVSKENVIIFPYQQGISSTIIIEKSNLS